MRTLIIINVAAADFTREGDAGGGNKSKDYGKRDLLTGTTGLFKLGSE